MKITPPDPAQLARAYALTALAREQMERKPVHALRLAERAYAATPAPLPVAKRVLADAFCRLGYANDGYFYKHLVSPEEEEVVYLHHNQFYLSTSKNDPRTRIWGRDGALLATFRTHVGSLSGGAYLFSDRRRLLIWKYEGAIQVWDEAGQLLFNLEEMGHIRGAWALPGEQRLLAWAEHSAPIRIYNLEGQVLAEFRGHQGEILGVDSLPAIEAVLSRGADFTARLWNYQGVHLATLEGHTNCINGAHLVDDGRRIFTWAADGTARLWELSGKPVTEIRCHPDGLFYGRISPDKQHFLSWDSQEGTVKIWNIHGALEATLLEPGSGIRSVQLMHGGQRITAFHRKEGSIRIWDWQGRLIKEIKAGDSPISKFCPTDDGQHIYLQYADGAMELRDADGNPAPGPAVPRCQFTQAWIFPGGRRILTWLRGESPKMWQPTSHLLRLQTAERLRGAGFLPDGRRILTLPHKGTPKIWSPEGQLLLELNAPEHYCRGIRLFAQQQRYLAWYGNGLVNVFDAAGNLLRTIGEERMGGKRMFSSQPEQIWVQQAHFFSDEQRLLLWHIDGQAGLWDLDGQQLASMNGLKSGLRGACVFADEQLTAAWGINGTSGIWNMQGELVGRIRKEVLDIQAIGNGSRLLALCYDGIPRICDAHGRIIKRLKGHSDRAVVAWVFPDGQRFLTWAVDGSARIWDSRGKALARLEEQTHSIRGAAILPGGHRIFTWAEDGRLRVWADDGALVATLGYPQGQVDGYQIFGEGRKLMGWNKEGIIRIWDEEGQLLEQLNAPDRALAAAQASSDGKRVLTWAGDSELRVWPLPDVVYEWLQGDPVDRLTEGEVGGYEGEMR